MTYDPEHTLPVPWRTGAEQSEIIFHYRNAYGPGYFTRDRSACGFNGYEDYIRRRGLELLVEDELY